MGSQSELELCAAERRQRRKRRARTVLVVVEQIVCRHVPVHPGPNAQTRMHTAVRGIGCANDGQKYQTKTPSRGLLLANQTQYQWKLG